MSIRGFFRFAINKLYYFGASVVIFGLVCQNLGLSFSKKVTILGLIFEALIFFFGMFSLEDEDKSNSGNENTDKNKKFYYTDGNGNYYLRNPNSGVPFPPQGVLPVGFNYDAKQLSNNSAYVNGDADWYRMPDINSDIDKLKERLEFLQSIKKQQIINLTRGVNNNNTDDVDNNKKEETFSTNHDKNDNSKVSIKTRRRFGRRKGGLNSEGGSVE